MTFEVSNILSDPDYGSKIPVGEIIVLTKRVLYIFALVFASSHGAAFADSSSAVSLTGTVAFSSSLSIIVRESLEAFLIIAAMIAALSAMNEKKSVKFVHIGWMAAIVAGFATWWVSSTLVRISGAQAEMIEGVTSLLAAAVLFYVSYWLISKVEVEKWKEYIESKVKLAVGKSAAAMAFVAFLAVYREALETVLFYQALIFQAGSSAGAVLWGFVVGTVVVAVLSIALFKLSVRLPIKYLFSITGLSLYALSFMLIGKGVHELQEAGVISETVADFVPHLSALGIYPTYESFLPQTVVIAAIVFAVYKVASAASGSSPKST